MEAATKKRKKDLEESDSPFLREALKWETLANLYSQGTSSDILELYESTFSDIAHNLLNKTYMVINGQKHRLVEIEFYYKNGGNHDDPFTHGDAIQLTSGKWYFHRMGNGYKGGSYKGLDITFGGQGEEDSKVYGGILIRAIEPIEGGGKSTSLIEGPSKVVDRVLELNGSTGIAEFVSAHFNNAAAPSAHHNEGSRLYLIPAEQMEEAAASVGKGKETEEKEEEKAEALPILEIYRSARVGLSLKRERAGLDTFVGRCYRFTSRPAWMKKGKPNMIIGLHQQGIAVPQIATIMKTAAKTITGYIDHYKAGQQKTPATFMGKALTTQSLCELLGAVSPGAQASKED